MHDVTDQRDPRTYAVIGAAMEVHRHLCHGFLEAVYQEALAVELELRQVPFQREPHVGVSYKGRPLRCSYIPDFLCFDSLVVELKAIARTGALEEAQIINYLRATGFEVGLLLNFGTESLTWKRVLLSQEHLR